MDIRAKIETSKLNTLAKNYPRNLAYSTAQALNDTAKDAQKAIRDNMAATFHMRSARTKAFLDRSIKITAWASVRQMRMFAQIEVDNKNRLLLSMFETGGDKHGWMGGRRLAIPFTGATGARQSADSQVSPQWLIKSLNMQKRPTQTRKNLSADPKNAKRRNKHSKAAYEFWQGNNQTFMLEKTGREPYGGIFHRVEKGRNGIRLLYSFKPSAKVKAQLRFIDLTSKTFADRFTLNLERRFYRLKGIGG